MPAAPRSVFQYAIVRVVPRVERGECLNVGVILLCRPRRFLGARIGLDERRLAAFAPDLDPASIRPHLEAIERIAAGDPTGGPDRPARDRPSGSTGWSRRRARSSSRRRSTPGCATTRRPSSTTSWRRWSTRRRSVSGRRAAPLRRGRPRACRRGSVRRRRIAARVDGSTIRRRRRKAASSRAPTWRAPPTPVSGMSSRKLDGPVRTARSESRASERIRSASSWATVSADRGSGVRPISSRRTDAGRP